MNWNQIEGNWNQVVGKAQAQWGLLTGDELDNIKGRQRELSGLIQERYGKTEEEAQREIDDWMSKINQSVS
ncbi:CsbD family protein [Roseibium limicola]|uniref:CsbD family protein n=1 Tax=Roseibium limicola TaxID=2816037 RepID=A0A939JAV5_9HYPH|nr:CsbD family protein [Roseibium limicola]MBO0347349.1 CsbD family protein [Roseibium limicola]